MAEESSKRVITLTAGELEQIVERSQNRAIEGLFLRIGVDIKDPDQVRELKENLSLLTRVGYGARLVKATTIKTCVGAIVAGLIALLILGFKDWIADVISQITQHRPR